MSDDRQVRLAALGWLRDRMAEEGEVLHRALLAAGFEFRGERVPLLGPQGIFKPRLCELPLSITTSPNGPYRDAVGADGLIEYRYRGHDPAHPENVGLRRAMVSQTQGQLIGLPRRPLERPDPVRLERRYERFVRAS